jgi:L-aspartate oxidase
MKTCDLLVIGCGIAGASLALQLAQKGLHIIVLSASKDPLESNSAWAQGGIVFAGLNDTPALLAKDIFDAGAGLCNPAAVDLLTSRGPKLVQDFLIDSIGVPFDSALTKEAAHSMPRILHSKDTTGRAIAESMIAAMKKEPNIELLTEHTAVDLITLSHHSEKYTDIYLPSTCVGAYVFDAAANRVKRIFAKETVLATGGLGEVYLHTSNPSDARGDGIAMAYRAGARIMNMEYVQFHPTTLYLPGKRRFLLSEALRGEGALLLNANMEPFMHRYHEKKELAPRDVVSRAIFSEMLSSSCDHLWLDMTGKNSDWIKDRFPLLTSTCWNNGYDLSSDPVPIVPAAHYRCGGISVDLKGCTTIERLRAIGEVSCTGLHGANRLASTSLLEGLVWSGPRSLQKICSLVGAKGEITFLRLVSGR